MAEARLLFIDDSNISTMSIIGDLPNSGEVSLVLSANVVLTNDQIKSLPTEAFEILPAPGSGKMFVPTFAILRGYFAAAYNAGPGDPGGALFDDLEIKVGQSGMMIIQNDATGSKLQSFLQNTGNFVALWPVQLTEAPGSAGELEKLIDSGNPTTSYDNQPLRLRAATDPELNFTGGNSANTLSVTVYYTIFTL